MVAGNPAPHSGNRTSLAVSMGVVRCYRSNPTDRHRKIGPQESQGDVERGRILDRCLGGYHLGLTMLPGCRPVVPHEVAKLRVGKASAGPDGFKCVHVHMLPHGNYLVKTKSNHTATKREVLSTYEKCYP